jgi:hypothetical protein
MMPNAGTISLLFVAFCFRSFGACTQLSPTLFGAGTIEGVIQHGNAVGAQSETENQLRPMTAQTGRSSSVSNVFYVDEFSHGSWRGAWSTSINYDISSAVGYNGTTWVAGTASASVRPRPSAATWFKIPNLISTSITSTALDVANVVALVWTAANHANSRLVLGAAGTYSTCMGVNFRSPDGIDVVDIQGSGHASFDRAVHAATLIRQTCSTQNPTVWLDQAIHGEPYTTVKLSNFVVDANDLAPSGLDVHGISGEMDNILVEGIKGLDHFIQIGGDGVGRGVAELNVRNVKANGGGLKANGDTPGGKGASYHANVSAGRVASYTHVGLGATFKGGNCRIQPYASVAAVDEHGAITKVNLNQGGVCLQTPTDISFPSGADASFRLGNGPDQGINYGYYRRISLYGYRTAGTRYVSDQPCEIMPHPPTATISGGKITALTPGANLGSGCTEQIDISISGVYPSAYGISIYASDSTFTDLLVQGAGLIGIMSRHGANTFIHPHQFVGQPIGFQDWGADTVIDGEGDNVAHYSIELRGSNSLIIGTKSYTGDGQYFPGLAEYQVMPAATGTLIIESPSILGPVQEDSHGLVSSTLGPLDTVISPGINAMHSDAAIRVRLPAGANRRSHLRGRYSESRLRFLFGRNPPSHRLGRLESRNDRHGDVSGGTSFTSQLHHERVTGGTTYLADSTLESTSAFALTVSVPLAPSSTYTATPSVPT